MPKSSLTIDRATRGDIPRLLDLYEHLIPGDERADDGAAIEAFERFLTYSGSAILIGEVDGVLAASCTLVVVPNLTRGATPYAIVENVVTHGAYRQQGYGRQLLDAATDAAWAEGCHKIMLLTGSKDRGTFNFYLGAGFEQSKTGFQKRRIPPKQDS